MGVNIDIEYLSELKKVNSFNLLFIGKDKYTKGAVQIPFCKANFEELDKANCSGKHLLYGLGFEINDIKKSENPKLFFLSLLKDKGIGFLNASYDEPQSRLLNKEQQMIFKKINLPLIKKAKVVATSIGGYRFLKQYLSEDLLNKIIIVCHPDVRNKLNKYKNEYAELWQTKNGFNNQHLCV